MTLTHNINLLGDIQSQILHIRDITANFVFEKIRFRTSKKIVYIKAVAEDTTLTVADGKAYVTIPDNLDNLRLYAIAASVYTVSSSGLPTIQLYNVTDSVDMLSTKITIDVSEKTSYTAAAPAVIDRTKDLVSTGDQLRIDVDVAGTGTKGLDVLLTFQTL